MRKIKRAAALVQAIITTATILFNVMPASAFGAEEALQTITAELYTDESYSESLLSDTVITLTGEMPEEASVKGYPVSYDIEGMETIAAYDITIFEKDGETVFQPADDQTVNVAFSIPQLEETNTESLSVFHIDGEGNQTEIADILGTTPQYYGKYEKGEREIPLMRAIELADYYDISLDYLAGRSNNKSYNADTPLAPDEIKIIELYRNLSERNKGKAELFIEQLNESP